MDWWRYIHSSRRCNEKKELASSIDSEFYPHLTPGACLIHQDYKHYYTPWIHILCFRLRDYFEPFHNVLGAATFSFKKVSNPSSECLKRAADVSSCSDKEIQSAIGYSMDLVDDMGKANIAAAHVMWFLNFGRFQEAKNLLSEYCESFGLIGELTIVKKILSSQYK